MIGLIFSVNSSSICGITHGYTISGDETKHSPLLRRMFCWGTFHIIFSFINLLSKATLGMVIDVGTDLNIKKIESGNPPNFGLCTGQPRSVHPSPPQPPQRNLDQPQWPTNLSCTRRYEPCRTDSDVIDFFPLTVYMLCKAYIELEMCIIIQYFMTGHWWIFYYTSS